MAPVAGQSGTTKRTRFLVLADTHGAYYLPDTKKLQPIDVVIHCGDITADSQLAEYKTAIRLLGQIDAPLKLVIPGNHDFTLDTPTYQRLLHRARKRRDFPKLLRTHGQPGDARHLLSSDGHANNNIHYLDEGTHRFRLPNGTALTVYASPYTPAFGTPGFQYRTGDSRGGVPGHDFAVPADVDIVVTHGPPRGVLDRVWGPPPPYSSSSSSRHVGSPELFAAVARARPRMHCFGHIHEGWGAEVVRWETENTTRYPSQEGEENEESDLQQRRGHNDNRPPSSTVIADLGSVLPLKGDSPEAVADKDRRLREYAAGKCIKTSHCVGDSLPVEKGASTLFVNAAVIGQPVRPPWIVDLELPVASEGNASVVENGEDHLVDSVASTDGIPMNEC